LITEQHESIKAKAQKKKQNRTIGTHADAQTHMQKLTHARTHTVHIEMHRCCLTRLTKVIIFIIL
jgi:hypothetical protein